MDRKEKAVEYKHTGSNCCQSVLKAFKDKIDLPEETLNKMGSAFCVGMGNMEGTCGALCAAEMILGLNKYEGKPVIREAKTISKEFQEKCGATACKDLKGIETGTVLCECDDCIRNAVEIISKNEIA
ncbi:MAG: C-GCAxxG-C-C family protein [Lachnospiraceae bacterium]|nr:C-GCAxxG-C-C family protein [Lachnospiraceae bacterium]